MLSNNRFAEIYATECLESSVGRCRCIQINLFATSSFKHVICWGQENTAAAIRKNLNRCTLSQMPKDSDGVNDHMLITRLYFSLTM